MINNLAYLETILTDGERVDGSSLFPSFVEAESSDLYVVPRFRTAFVSPFSDIPTLCLLCSFFDKDGRPFDCSPEQTLHRAAAAFTEATGMTYEAMGELEYYVIAEDDEMFPAVDQRGYHESGPFAKFNEFRKKCMAYIAQTGGQTKYGHSEVGNFTADGKVYEQNEVEFLPCPVESAADQLVLAKWVIRNLAYEYGLDVTFAPKITVGKACRNDDARPVDNRLRQQDSRVLLPPCAPPGGADERLLGRLQPLGARARAVRLDFGQGHVRAGQQPGE